MFNISSNAQFRDGILTEVNVHAHYQNTGEYEIYRKDFEEKLERELVKIREEILDYRKSAMVSRMLAEKKQEAADVPGESPTTS